MKLFLLCALFTIALCGTKISYETKRCYQCNESYATTWPASMPMNCSNPIYVPAINEYKCQDPGCEGGNWQWGYYLNKLVCCQPLCPSYNCGGTKLYLAVDLLSTNPYSVDYGKTFKNIYDVLPPCPDTGYNKNLCYTWSLDGCPSDITIFPFFDVWTFCRSTSCTGNITLNETANTFECQDSSCEGSGKQMIFSDELKKWVCKSPFCDIQDMVYSPTQRKWLCSKDSSYCKQAREECASDMQLFQV